MSLFDYSYCFNSSRDLLSVTAIYINRKIIFLNIYILHDIINNFKIIYFNNFNFNILVCTFLNSWIIAYFNYLCILLRGGIIFFYNTICRFRSMHQLLDFPFLLIFLLQSNKKAHQQILWRNFILILSIFKSFALYHIKFELSRIKFRMQVLWMTQGFTTCVLIIGV